MAETPDSAHRLMDELHRTILQQSVSLERERIRDSLETQYLAVHAERGHNISSHSSKSLNES